MSRWAAGVKFEDLSQDAVYQAKRFLLDSVGCALGGYQQHDVAIALDVLNEVAASGPATVIGYRQEDGRRSRGTGQRADDPLHGLQRHLLEAGSVASVRHLSRRHRLCRARGQRWARTDRRPRPRTRIRAASVRSGIPRHSRARLASRDADRLRLADRCRAHAAPPVGADAARHRHLAPAHAHASARSPPASSP